MPEVKVTKRKYYRKYFRRKYRRYKTVSNYFNVKLNLSMQAIYEYEPEGQAPEAVTFGIGNPDIAMNTNHFLYVLLQACPLWTTYSSLFSMFRLRGFAVVATPAGGNTLSPARIAFKLGLVKQGSGYDWRLVSESNNSMMLSPVAKTRFYAPLLGSVGWLKTANIASDLPGQIMFARYPDNANSNIGLNWTIEFIFYVGFKLSLY